MLFCSMVHKLLSCGELVVVKILFLVFLLFSFDSIYADPGSGRSASGEVELSVLSTGDAAVVSARRNRERALTDEDLQKQVDDLNRLEQEAERCEQARILAAKKKELRSGRFRQRVFDAVNLDQDRAPDIIDSIFGKALPGAARYLDNGVSYNPLQYAASCNKPWLVRPLVKAGVDLSWCILDGGSVPITIAASAGHKRVVEEILGVDGTQKDFRTTRGVSALDVAALTGRTEIVKLLLREGASPVGYAVEHHRKLSHDVAKRGHHKLANLIDLQEKELLSSR